MRRLGAADYLDDPSARRLVWEHDQRARLLFRTWAQGLLAGIFAGATAASYVWWCMGVLSHV